MPGELEHNVEKKVQRWVEEQGGRWIKLVSRKGLPDDLLLLPPITIEKWEYPVHVFVEMKRPIGGILSPHQEWWLHELSSLQQPAYVCNSLQHVKDVVDHVKQSIRRRVLGPRADLS